MHAIRTRCLLLSGVVLLGIAAPEVRADEPVRPNFVLLVSEDNSAHFMRHFHPAGTDMPNLEALAEQGITFDRAFSNAPVCSVARTTVINSVHAPAVATHHHRRLEPVRMPAGWQIFPYYLEQDGYFTVKRGKKDFNMLEGEDMWNADGPHAHWRDRRDDDTPFFYMEQTGNDTHEGQLHFDHDIFSNEPTEHDPAKIKLFPYLPDTPLIRYTHAYYLDRHRDLDRRIGQVLGDLQDDGLRESTIILYYGDHGGSLPRSKGYLFEKGLHVPMIVHIPKQFQHLASFEPGDRVDGFVEFVDIGPTILHLAGVGLPAHMHGRPFLGTDVTAMHLAERDETFSYVDRLDEKCDMVRALRKGDYKYIRYYHPQYSDSLRNRYRFLQLAYQQWSELYAGGDLDDLQRQFFKPRLPEALYNLADDPHETRNLAGDPDYADVLEDMRGRLRQRMQRLPDLGLFPESYLIEHAVDDPLEFAQRHTTRVRKILDIADLALVPFEQARPHLERTLGANDPIKQYWALNVCSGFADEAATLANRAHTLAVDASLPVRVRAAEFLALLRDPEALPLLYDALADATHQADALLVLNTLTFLKHDHGYDIDPERVAPPMRTRQINWALENVGVSG